MKRLILGALLLLSTVSFGQISLETRTYYNGDFTSEKNFWELHEDSLIQTQLGKNVSTIYAIKFDMIMPLYYKGVLKNEQSETIVSIDFFDKSVLMVTKDLVTNEIKKALYK